MTPRLHALAALLHSISTSVALSVRRAIARTSSIPSTLPHACSNAHVLSATEAQPINNPTNHTLTIPLRLKHTTTTTGPRLPSHHHNDDTNPNQRRGTHLGTDSQQVQLTVHATRPGRSAGCGRLVQTLPSPRTLVLRIYRRRREGA